MLNEIQKWNIWLLAGDNIQLVQDMDTWRERALEQARFLTNETKKTHQAILAGSAADQQYVELARQATLIKESRLIIPTEAQAEAYRSCLYATRKQKEAIKVHQMVLCYHSGQPRGERMRVVDIIPTGIEDVRLYKLINAYSSFYYATVDCIDIPRTRYE